ncbi:MAG: hypothetical protein DLM68_14695 [Hyphomicrobiales bacterium]|nr:MAG: hypothetical protein DLM68_14695 [Hyphomicrobiales bacterium]
MFQSNCVISGGGPYIGAAAALIDGLPHAMRLAGWHSRLHRRAQGRQREPARHRRGKHRHPSGHRAKRRREAAGTRQSRDGRRLPMACGTAARRRSPFGARPRLLPKLDARDIRCLGGLAKEERGFSFDTARLAAAALPLCRDVASLLRPVKPSDRAHCARGEPF